MKEIEIEMEQKKPIWLWLLAGVVITALLVWLLVFRNGGNNTEALTQMSENDLLEVRENNSVVVAYINFVANTNAEMTLDHAYTHGALIKLTAATDAMANEVGYEVQADLEKVKEYAHLITIDPLDTTHADNIRKAADILTNVLQNIQMAKYPSLLAEVEALKSAAGAINPDILTLQQKDAVKNYFAKASDLLQKMN